MEFSRHKYWRLPCPPSQDLPDPGIEPTFLVFPSLAGRYTTTEPPGKPKYWIELILFHLSTSTVGLKMNKKQSSLCEGNLSVEVGTHQYCNSGTTPRVLEGWCNKGLGRVKEGRFTFCWRYQESLQTKGLALELDLVRAWAQWVKKGKSGMEKISVLRK